MSNQYNLSTRNGMNMSYRGADFSVTALCTALYNPIIGLPKQKLRMQRMGMLELYFTMGILLKLGKVT